MSSQSIRLIFLPVFFFALGLVGWTFVGYAAFLFFLPLTGALAAALIVGGVFLLLSLVVYLFCVSDRQSRVASATTTRPIDFSRATNDDAILKTLANGARDKPLTSLLLAGLFGAATLFLEDEKH